MHIFALEKINVKRKLSYWTKKTANLLNNPKFDRLTPVSYNGVGCKSYLDCGFFAVPLCRIDCSSTLSAFITFTTELGEKLTTQFIMRILKLCFISSVISLLYLSCSPVTTISYDHYKYLPEGKQGSENNTVINHPTTIDFNFSRKIILIKSQNKTDTLIIKSDVKNDSFIIQNKSDNTNGMMKISDNSCLVVLKILNGT